MSQTAPDPTDLSRLHDIVTPAHAPLWPPAPGMAIALVIVAALIVTLLYHALVRHQRNRYRREALHELKRTTQPAAIAALLKRTALTAYPRDHVAPLTGAPWFAFLDRTASTTAFTKTAGPLIEKATYQDATLNSADITTLIEATGHWIKKHQRLAGTELETENRKL